MLMQTDLPLPVAPAISRCGIFARSPTTASPLTSRPSASRSFERGFDHGSDSNSSRRLTVWPERFGTSMPTTRRPGTGASSRSADAPSRSDRSCWRARIWFTATPGAGSSPNWVTVGPELTSTTRAWMLKLASVSSITFACARTSVWLSSTTGAALKIVTARQPPDLRAADVPGIGG